MSTLTVNPSGYDNTRFSVKNSSNIENAYTNTESSTCATFGLQNGSTKTYVYFTFDLSSLPANAVIDSVSCNVKANITNANTARIAVKTMQLYTGTTAKGTTTDIPTSLATVSIADPGTWTREELNSLALRFYVERGYSGTSNAYYIYVYGADLTITYTAGGSTETLKIKSNGSWQDVSKVYLKENGSWVEQNNLSTLFDVNANYVKEN